MKESGSSLSCHGVISLHNILAVLPTYQSIITVFSLKKKKGGVLVAKHFYKPECSVLRS